MPKDATRHEVYSDYARSLIRQKARQLSRRGDFSRSDEEDIAQELTLHLLSQAERFDASRASLKTFVTHVVNSCVAMILRERWRQKRVPKNDAEIQSLEVTVDVRDEPPVALWDVISPADVERRTGGRSRSNSDVHDEAEAVAQVLRGLPDEDLDICERLKVGSQSSVARDLDISRQKLRRLISNMREHFEQAGLGRG
jgi:RNA polymerase sigma factor (sigma-70 family)